MKRFLLLSTVTLGILVAGGWPYSATTAADAVSIAVGPPSDDTCEFDGVDRIVAVGDVHGAYDRFVEILTAAGVIDKRLRWTGGKTHLVQLGDVVDRGPDSRKAIDLLKKLERDADNKVLPAESAESAEKTTE